MCLYCDVYFTFNHQLVMYMHVQISAVYWQRGTYGKGGIYM